MDIYRGGERLNIDLLSIKRIFEKPLPMPRLSEHKVIVCHGECYDGYTIFEIPIDDSFKPDKLKMSFEDCGDTGFVLTNMIYDGKKFSGTDKSEKKEPLKLQFFTK